jgi:hypothetical protein
MSLKLRVCDLPLSTLVVASAAAVVVWAGSAAGMRAEQAQTPAAQGAPAGREGGAPGQGRQAGRGGRGAATPQGGAPIAFDNYTGFRQIFDGKTLAGWDGDSTFWRVEAGKIVGESTAEKPVTQNTFIIWRGGQPADFDLKVEFLIHGGNTGVQYRSVQLPEGGADKIGKWVLKGYQADIDFNNQYTGMLYEERGRGFLAPRGQFNYVGANQAPPTPRGGTPPVPAAGAAPFGVRGQLGALNSSDALRAAIKQNDWNQFQVIARGNVVIHVLNGHVTAMLVDDDAAARAMSGLIGLQIHTGPPMKVEFRNIYLKTL